MKEKVFLFFCVASDAKLDINRRKGSSIKIDEVCIHIHFSQNICYSSLTMKMKCTVYQTELAFKGETEMTQLGYGTDTRGINKRR